MLEEATAQKKMCISTIVGESNVFSLHAHDDSPVVFTNPDKPCFSGEVAHIWDHTMGVFLIYKGDGFVLAYSQASPSSQMFLVLLPPLLIEH